MAFDGASAIEPLSYTGLTAFGIPDGTIPEPTNEALVAFMGAVQALAEQPEGTTPEALLGQAHEAAASLCSGTPSADQLAGLPPRLFREFVKWLAGEFTDPKG